MGTEPRPPRRGYAEPRPYVLVASLAVVAATALRLTGFRSYQAYFGRLDPILVTIVAAVLGWAVLRSLDASGRRPTRPGDRGLGRAAVLATVLALFMIAVDSRIPFPADINVASPAALLFYPSIGLVAEVAFHLLPLGLVALSLDRFPALRGSSGPLLAGLVVASLVEPTFQVVPSVTGPIPFVLRAYVAVHIWVLSGLQLWLFRRHGFLAMYLLRLVYYVWWHIAWGTLRLELLF